jgi:hypothetical protein
MVMRFSLLSLVAIGTLSGCFNFEPTPEERFVERVEDNIRRGMKDPDSVQFKTGFVDLKREIACGEVNAKNAYGGYVGFEPYSYYQGQYHLQSEDTKAYLLGSGYCLVTQAEQGIADAKKGDLPAADKEKLIKMYQKNIDYIKRNPTFGA